MVIRGPLRFLSLMFLAILERSSGHAMPAMGAGIAWAGPVWSESEQASPNVPAVQPGRGRFSQGRWFAQTMGSAAFGDENGEVYSGHVGIGYFLFDDFSISLDALGGYIKIEEGHFSSETFYGLDLLMRHHVWKNKNWSFYIDGGAGLQKSSDPFPVGGTHSNFRPQAGVGLSLGLTPKTLLMAGVRWLHISNASRKGVDRNPGYDSALVYAGVMIPF